MLANDTGDTNYTDGKQYYYNYSFYPVVGVTIFQLQVKSGTDAVVSKIVTTNMVVKCTLTDELMFPPPGVPGLYEFYVNYTSAWGITPVYVNVSIDEVEHAMAKNDSGDTNYVDGCNYHFSTNLTSGVHNYSFHATENLAYGDHTNGLFYARISADNMTISLSPDLNALILGTIFGFGLIILSVIDKRHKIWPVFAGLAWFMISVVAYYPVGVGWMVLGIGIGLILWIEGTLGYAAGRQKT
jgi:hypothetical protein